MDHYETLGVSRDASQESIKHAYVQKAVKLHPDKNVGALADGDVARGPSMSNDDFVKVQRAWEVLRESDSRARYDAELRERETREKFGVVNEDIDLDSLFFDEESGNFTHPCRCGGIYTVTEEMLERGENVVQCAGCSLLIRVLFERLEDA
ncbi:DNAJ heat shock N-terminal domain-containing protein [Gonapodya prolifera JEL478]|uniref:Diphthamide biosynthesis protein 4 n=1 Tax=Gonapodya prolifera (strain JEL478) TaxID=1344416 RepID=A0A139AY21_GONPJ|nr:DNAJ heat shock N-terminal domain-containing protein [Gonapodya prolifera JEL478]|eukprot:KXS21597.1 DNAJ heat shock N-terminal domain-containing protein [Gonapodya prolifera JEL478]